MSGAAPLLQFLATGRATVSALAAAPGRDLRIDAIRGLALLVIFINHMPGNVVAQWMPHNFGFSDAADIFVLLAGVSATLAYGSMIERRGLGLTVLKLGARLWTLYIAHIALFVIVCGVVAAAVTRTQNPLYIESINIQPFFTDTLSALGDALTLVYQPYYLDILPLYLVLLASFPLVYALVKLSPLAAVALSVLIWQLAVAAGLNLPNTGSSGWFFNPFAWQLVFTMGVVIGRSAQLGLSLPALRTVDVAAVAVLLGSLAIKVSSGNPFGLAFLDEWVEAIQLGNDKTNLSVARVLHLASLVWVVIRLVPAGAGWVRGAIGRNLAAIGRHSLEVFCVGIVLSILGQIVMAETSFDVGTQLIVCAAGVTLLATLGKFLSWFKSLSRPEAKTAPRSDGQALASASPSPQPARS